MSGLAEVLLHKGFEVSGSDLQSTAVTQYLESLGARVQKGHGGPVMDNADAVVVSRAVSEENVELIEARRRRLPIVARGEMLAELMRDQQGIAVAGTHGKTTTTSLIATVLEGTRFDPTVLIGGGMKQLRGNGKLGASDFMVAEADESDGSFLLLSPTIGVVTTLDEEHMNHYENLDNMKNAFLQFINAAPFYGASILCADDPNIRSLIPHATKRTVTYGLSDDADLSARNIQTKDLKTSFSVIYRGKDLGSIRLGILGHHNVRNTLAAVAVGLELGLDFKSIADSLRKFAGVHRRFDILGQSKKLLLVDDYGHHPAEIQVTLKTAKETWPGRKLIVVFQPHRYSRTQSLLTSFFTAFGDADELIITDIYSSGEAPIEGVHSRRLVEGAQNAGHPAARYLENPDAALHYLRSHLKEGDVVLTLGAGDIWKLNRNLYSDFFEEGDANSSIERIP